MTGHIVTDLKAETITKTTGGILVLPADNEVVRFMSRSLELWTRRGKASCDQCRDCTVLCPRHLLGHDFSPHEIMRAGAYGINVKNSVLTGCRHVLRMQAVRGLFLPAGTLPDAVLQEYEARSGSRRVEER